MSASEGRATRCVWGAYYISALLPHSVAFLSTPNEGIGLHGPTEAAAAQSSNPTLKGDQHGCSPSCVLSLKSLAFF